jgi:hypothetical protein
MGFWVRLRSKLGVFVPVLLADVFTHIVAIEIVERSRAVRTSEVRRVVVTAATWTADNLLVITILLLAFTMLWISVRAKREIAAANASLVKQKDFPSSQRTDEPKAAATVTSTETPRDRVLRVLRTLTLVNWHVTTANLVTALAVVASDHEVVMALFKLRKEGLVTWPREEDTGIGWDDQLTIVKRETDTSP